MKRAAGVLGMLLAFVFAVMAFNTAVPEGTIEAYGNGNAAEAAAGNAYGTVIEAALRGGEISGAMTARAVYWSAAAILCVLSLSFLGAAAPEDQAEAGEKRG